MKLRKPKNGTSQVNAPSEGPVETAFLKLALGGKLAKAGRDAIRRQRAKGLAVTFKRGQEIIKQYPDGREEILGRVAPRRFRMPKNVPIIGEK